MSKRIADRQPALSIMNVKFNIPKNAEDERKLLIDLENNVGVILRKEKGNFIVSVINIEKERKKWHGKGFTSGLRHALRIKQQMDKLRKNNENTNRNIFQ